MLDTLLTGLGGVLMAVGAFFLVVGALGLVRMPDVFARMHAASIVETLGAGLLIAGMMIEAGLSLVTVKLLFILIAILFTSPVATHALAQAALHSGVVPVLASKKALGIPLEQAATRQAFETQRAPRSTGKARAKPRRKTSKAPKKGGGPSKPS